jgi:hypothetical protein
MNPVVGDIMEMVIFCQTNRDVALNVRHYRIQAIAGAGKTWLQIANGLHSLFGPLYAPAMSTAAVFYQVAVARISPLPRGQQYVSTNATVQGTEISDVLPGQATGLITLTTGFGGVQYRGRAYIPFPGEDFNDDPGVPTLAYQAILDPIGNAMINDTLIGALPDQVTLDPILWHRDTETYDVLTGSVSRNRWGTQRRRNNARGRIF